MDMNCYQCFEFRSFDFRQISSSLIDKRIQQFQKLIICLGHNFLILSSLEQRQFRVSCPNHLQTQQTDLEPQNIIRKYKYNPIILLLETASSPKMATNKNSHR